MNEIRSNDLGGDEVEKTSTGFRNLTIPSVHAAFAHVKTRLSCLNSIFRHCPGLAANLRYQLDGVPNTEVVSAVDRYGWKAFDVLSLAYRCNGCSFTVGRIVSSSGSSKYLTKKYLAKESAIS